MNPLIRLIPPPLVRFFARPYVAGASLAQATGVAARLWQQQGLATTLDLLAEDIEDEAVVERNVQTYLGMVDAAADDARFGEAGRPTVSLKLSSYTTAPLEAAGDAKGSREAAFRISEHAGQRGVGVSIDMESRHWTDFTLQTLRALHAAGHRHVGAVLQTRLHRTRRDLDHLPEGCRVRLVIGIYQEPAEVALTDKRAMKERLLEHAAILLQRGHYVEFATHDEQFVRRFVDDVVPAAGAGPQAFELQMLYGVPRDALLQQMRNRGVRARLYVPFALSWPMAIAYLRRRLDEYPAMMWLVAKNELQRLLGWGGARGAVASPAASAPPTGSASTTASTADPAGSRGSDGSGSSGSSAKPGGSGSPGSSARSGAPSREGERTPPGPGHPGSAPGPSAGTAGGSPPASPPPGPSRSAPPAGASRASS